MEVNNFAEFKEILVLNVALAYPYKITSLLFISKAESKFFDKSKL
jgi:hypothetical protein